MFEDSRTHDAAPRFASFYNQHPATWQFPRGPGIDLKHLLEVPELPNYAR